MSARMLTLGVIASLLSHRRLADDDPNPTESTLAPTDAKSDQAWPQPFTP